MFSSDDKRFQWAKADRQEEPTLFRQMIKKWQPQLQLTRPGLETTRARKPKPARPVWTPWLWVK
jgi:hypothetical protein